MCFGGSSNADQELAAQEARRTKAIEAGQKNINQAFGGFDDKFYSGVRENTINTLMPQAEGQYRTTRKKLGFSLAGKGLMSSSFGREAATDLEVNRQVAQQSVVNQGNEAVRSVKGQVQAEKANVTAQLIQSQNPNMAAQQAIGAAASIQAPSPIAPLGQLFQSFANTYLGYKVGQTYASEPVQRSVEMGKNVVRK
jgi:hypothetical protein